MGRTPRRRFWVEAVVAGLGLFLALLTLVTREWIEILFGVDPDGGSGELEWLIAAGLLLAAGIAALAARAEWRRALTGAA